MSEKTLYVRITAYGGIEKNTAYLKGLGFQPTKKPFEANIYMVVYEGYVNETAFVALKNDWNFSIRKLDGIRPETQKPCKGYSKVQEAYAAER